MSTEPSIIELEGRMRPGAYSRKGFLGPTESLQAVMAQDDQTLKTLGITHEEIADALERVLQGVDDQIARLQRDGKLEELSNREKDLFPRIGVDCLPSIDLGYLIGGNLHVFIVRYRGFQACPWDCGEPIPQWSMLDFLLLNRQSGKYVTGPGMIVHLIREHHFFEGPESPYRVDPVKAVQVLELATEVDKV